MPHQKQRINIIFDFHGISKNARNINELIVIYIEYKMKYLYQKRIFMLFLSLPALRIRWHLMGMAALVYSAQAPADTGLNWKNSSDMLAIGLPALAAGAAWGQGDTEGLKQLSLSMATSVGTAEVLKRSVHSMRPDGSDNKSFPSTHTAVVFAAARFMDKRYGAQMASYTPWLYVAAGMTGVARVEANKHHWRDVLAGGALGWSASQWWTQPVQGGQLSVLPADHGLSLAWYRTW
jgi:membrane-associated phospholipid phosphatase